MHANAAVCQGISHSVFVAIIDPGNDEHPFFRQILVLSRVTEEFAYGAGRKGGVQRLECHVKGIRFRGGFGSGEGCKPHKIDELCH